MPKDDLREIKKKIDAVTTNIKIYKRELRQYTKQLKEEFDVVNIDDIDSLVKDLESQVDSLNEKRNRLLSKASQLLRDVTNA